MGGPGCVCVTMEMSTSRESRATGRSQRDPVSLTPTPRTGILLRASASTAARVPTALASRHTHKEKTGASDPMAKELKNRAGDPEASFENRKQRGSNEGQEKAARGPGTKRIP